MNRIVLIRHVETAMAGRFCGHSDPVLSVSGERQIASVVERVESLGIGHIRSSDLRRAAQTATAIGRKIGIDIEFRPGLREIDFGLWEGLNWEEIEERFPAEAMLWAKEFPLGIPPDGEAHAHFAARVESEFAPFLAQTGGRATAVVTHRGVLQYVLRRFFDFPETDAREKTAPYGAVLIASRSRGKWKVLP